MVGTGALRPWVTGEIGESARGGLGPQGMGACVVTRSHLLANQIRVVV